MFLRLSQSIALLLFMLLTAEHVLAASQISLNKMEKEERIGSTRITLFFSGLPNFETDHSGQRIDLLLGNSRVSTKLRSLPEDETVVKILLAQKQRDLMVSFLLRKLPKQVITESQSNPARVEIDLIWDTGQGTRPGVAFRITDMPPRKAGKDAKDYEKESPWEGRWRDFFRDYRTDWVVKLPLTYSQPPLPPLISNQRDLLWPLQQFAQENKWLSLQRQTISIADLSEQQKYLRNLYLVEAQLRSKAYDAGIARLNLLQGAGKSEAVRVGYLTALAQALTGQPFLAQLTLQELLKDLPSDHPLAAALYLLAAETALASSQNQLALSYLQNPDISWSDALLAVIDLRRADALAGSGALVEAVSAYQDLVEEKSLFEAYLFSCNQAAQSAFKIKDYALARILFGKLNALVTDQPGADLIQFAAGAAAYETGDYEWGFIELQKTTLDHPGTAGGGRAELRLTDHQLLNGGELEMAQAAAIYGQLGLNASNRMVREEATFKQALALFLLADHSESVNRLMHFRREFSSSKLRRETDILLLEQLPTVIHQLLEEKNELQAVVLVEQNRQLLLRGGFSREFLKDLAAAFNQLGLYQRSTRVLLYLFDQSKSEKQRKPLYLPLAKSYLKRDEYANASDYASRYLKKYPRGTDSSALFGLLLKAFARQDRNAELLAWLNRRNRPSSPELEISAAWIYWQQGFYKKAVSSLERARKNGSELEVKEMALLGEAYFKLRQNNNAGKIYRQLLDDKKYSSQARYRSAQLLLRKKQRGEALNLLAQLVDEDGGSRWGKLAQDLLLQEKY